MLTTVSAQVLKKNILYGSFTSRFVAVLVDTSILVFCYSLIFYSATGEDVQATNWKQILQNGINLQELVYIGKLVLYTPYFIVAHWLYYTVLESSPKQATIGKFTLGLQVTDYRGRRISFLRANLRYFSRVLSLAPLALGYLLILSTPRRQALHDYAANTVVTAL